MNALDWTILIIYIILIIGMGWYIGKRQKSQVDYYLGGRNMPAWQIAFSIMATQVSAISLIGAPAFIALRQNGGLKWLQYEFAIPLAMMGIMLLLVPIYHKSKSITIYEYLERRFGSFLRTLISIVFQVSRGLGAGVALLATAIVTSVCLDISLSNTILLIGIVSIIYTSFGGIVADIYSDIIQLVVLWGGSIITIFILVNLQGADSLSFLSSDIPRLTVFNFQATGFGDGQTFAFWPMLIGGFFLYFSYYGCDQSQSQRLLTTKTEHDAHKALVINGLSRFPLVLTYSVIGILLIPFLNSHSRFASSLESVKPDFLIPYFLLEYMPHGLLGLLIAGLFAASMSSIDSALNSLSASTYHDILIKKFPEWKMYPEKKQVTISRLLTIAWGMVATLFALMMIGGSETVLELVNKIGSAFYGPILAIFWIGMLIKNANQNGAITGLIAGVLCNLILWKFYEDQVSWLWWNVIGFAVSILVAVIISTIFKSAKDDRETSRLMINKTEILSRIKTQMFFRWLFAGFIVIILVGIILELILT